MYKIYKTQQVVVNSQYRNQYVCEIELMEGDADHYQTISIEIEEERVDVFEKTLQKIKKLNDLKKYEDVEFFHLLLREDWPYQCEGELPWRYEGHNYFWYDSCGMKIEAFVKP